MRRLTSLNPKCILNTPLMRSKPVTPRHHYAPAVQGAPPSLTAGHGLCCAVQSTAGLKFDQAHWPTLEVRYSRHPVAEMLHAGSGRVMFQSLKGSQRGNRSGTASPRPAAALPGGRVARQLTVRR